MKRWVKWLIVIGISFLLLFGVLAALTFIFPDSAVFSGPFMIAKKIIEIPLLPAKFMSTPTKNIYIIPNRTNMTE